MPGPWAFRGDSGGALLGGIARGGGKKNPIPTGDMGFSKVTPIYLLARTASPSIEGWRRKEAI